MSRRDPRGRALALAFALGTCLAVLWPDGSVIMGILGDPLGETDNHWWMLWRSGQELLGGAELLANAPVGVPIPLMDPINLPIFLLGSGFGPIIGWNLLAFASVGIAAWGGYRLAREVAGPRAALIGLVGTGGAPFLAGVIDFGITESWPIGLMALHAAALLRHARLGDRKDALLAGLCLGAVGLSGWYHAFFVLLLEAMLVPWLWWRTRRPLLWGQGLIGFVMVLPAWLRFQQARELWAGRWLAPSPGPPGPRPDWADLPVFGTDLLTFLLPRWSTVHPSKAVYLGILLCSLVLVGLLSRRRASAGMLLLAAPFLVLALGHWPTLAGKALGMPGPAWLLSTWLPSFRGLSHWHRAVGAAVPFLAAAAAAGVESRPRLVRLAPLLSVLILVDGIAFAPTAWPRTTIDPTPPASLRSIPGEAGMVLIPFDNDREPFSQEPARIYNRWQVMLGRPLSESYEGVDALLARSRLVAAAQTACWPHSTLPPYYEPPPEMREVAPLEDPEEIAHEREQLRAWGYEWIVVLRDRCRVPARALPALESMLGPGERLEGGDRAWRL